MNRAFVENAIWGIPSASRSASDWGARRTSEAVPIKRQLKTFLGEQLDQFRPDLLIVVERKATAIVRALMESEDPLRWPWGKVLSSSAVAQVPDEYFENKRILVFDDMMRTGTHLREVLGHLKRRRVWDLASNNVRVAVFAVHEERKENAPEERFLGEPLPHAWFYRDLPTPAYREIRTQIIRMLQKAGSLMLDTEHIEVRVRLRDNLSRFLELLRRRADAVLFHSAGERTNITVYFPDDDAHVLPPKLFPSGTKLNGIVKKCRIVERAREEFAILPICYPSVPDRPCDGWPATIEDKALFDPRTLCDSEACFYATGLVAALEVLRWVLKDLGSADPGTYALSLPSEPSLGPERGGYTLEHLNVMSPGLDVSRLTQRIVDIENRARAEGNRLRGRKRKNEQSHRFNDEDLRENSIQLLQMIRHSLDDEIREAISNGEKPPGHPHGLTAKEIFSIGKEKIWMGGRSNKCLIRYTD